MENTPTPITQKIATQHWRQAAAERDAHFYQSIPVIRQKCAKLLLRIREAREQHTDRIRPVVAMNVPNVPSVPAESSPDISEKATELVATPTPEDWLNSDRIPVPVEMSPKEPIITTFSYNPNSHPALWLEYAILNHRIPAIVRMFGPDALPHTIQVGAETWLKLLAFRQTSRYRITIEISDVVVDNEIRCLSFLRD